MRRWSCQEVTRRLIAVSFPGATAGRKLVNAVFLVLLYALRGRNRYPQNVNDTVS